MSSITISFTGNTSELTSTFFPEIVLDEGYNYSCGLLDFTTYHSVPNITTKNNIVHYSRDDNKRAFFRIPIGCYEAEEILIYIQVKFTEIGVIFEYTLNKNTLKTTIKCNTPLHIESKSVFEVLGFVNKNVTLDLVTESGNLLKFPKNGRTISADVQTESDDVVKISKLNVIRIECNIVTGAYVNGRLCHSLYEFASNKVDLGYKIVEQPNNIIYMPVVPRRINCIQISVVDQDGEKVDFRGEDITCRIHIKRDEK